MPVLVLAMSSVLSSAACWRYQVVQSICPQANYPTTTFDLTAVRTAEHDVIGRIVTSDSEKPIPVANVRYADSEGPAVFTADDGQFRLRTDTLGVYTLDVRRIGYAQAVGRLRVTTNGVGSLVILMRPTMFTMDGCGYVQFRRRRPWWQWWYPPPAV